MTGDPSESQPPVDWTESTLRDVLGAAPDAILVVDEGGKVLLVNRSVKVMFGLDEEEIVGRSIDVLVPERFRSEHPAHRAHYMASPRVRPVGAGLSLFAVRADGTEFPCEISLSPLRHGDRTLVVAAVRDMTEHVTARARLQESRGRLDSTRVLDTLLGNLPGFAYRCLNDRDYRMEFISGGCVQLTGHHPNEFLEQRVSYGRSVIDPEDRERVWELVQSHVAKRIPYEMEYRVRTVNGDAKWVWERGVGVQGDEGEVVALEGFVSDITGRRRAELERERLRRHALERDRMADIGAVVSKVAHDFGNALAGIAMQAQLIQRRAEQGRPIDTVAESSRLLVSETARLGEIISELREIARDPTLTRVDVELPGFLAKAQKVWSPIAEQHRTRIDVTVEESARVTLRADEGKLRRVVDNLVKNALDAIGEGPGEVVIKASSSPPFEQVTISVEDTGAGVAPDIDVFRMFETTKDEGTGLGLSVCRQIVAAHGGEIWFEGREPHGTVFHVELPVEG